EAAAVFYFPIDWAWTIRRVLRALQPAAVLIMETELWPHLLSECRARAIPVALINGRISETSFWRYKLIGSFMRHVINDLTIALMQSDRDAARIRELGLAADRVLMSGNVKFDSAEVAGDAPVTNALRTRFGFSEATQLIVAGSTHAPEEAVIIGAFKNLKASQPGVRLLIAPRHPERFSEVATLLQKSGLDWARRSARQEPADSDCEVILLDSVGELRAAYRLATVAFVGGSISPNGGHNVLEPASLGVAVVTGPHTENFAAITKALVDENALVQLRNVEPAQTSSELASALGELLADGKRRHEIGRRALAVCNQNRGATERTLQVIEGVLAGTTTLDERLPFSALHATPAK
ncbi:MAG: 3-deoxy-D-manno-octulosonic acid transferase, partial [Acidobacteriota bacterium]